MISEVKLNKKKKLKNNFPHFSIISYIRVSVQLPGVEYTPNGYFTLLGSLDIRSGIFLVEIIPS